MELKQFLQNYNTEDIINAIIIMSADPDPILADTNIPAAEWIASNALRYNNNNSDNKFGINAYTELKQIAFNIYAPLVSEIFEDVIKHKHDTDEDKQGILKSMLMKLKTAASRGDAYLFQLMEMAEKLYKPFDADFLEVYGFSFSCCEKVFVHMYKRYIAELFGTRVDSVKIEKIQRHSFKISKVELYQIFSKSEIDGIITYLSIGLGSSTIKDVGINDFKPLYSKPLIDYGEYVYFPLPVSTLLNFPKWFHYSFIAEKIFKKEVVSKYTKNRGDVIEKLTKEYLLRLFDNVHLALKYPPETKAFEADVTAQSENTTIFAEAKGKILTLSSLNGNLVSINDDVYKAIGRAYEQAIRSINHLESGGSFIQETDEGDKKVNLNNTTWKFPVCIMAENFASIPSEIYDYLDVSDNKLMPYAVNIYDLDIITRECNSKEEFISYLLFRQMNIQKLTSMDELDFFGYFKQRGLVKITTDADEVWTGSYTEDFDKKYYGLSMRWFDEFKS
ncbi:MAG: hypothetical protein LKF71_08045 [Oscillospiraceae bacterium]|jgi:hypothetical protein|nr:hypothetical protein [Oscillospiraceae bacterium]